jgi:SNF2 family DNA or RNA helicase
MITKKEARMNLPEKSYDIYEVGMTKAQTDIYNKMASHLAVSLGDLDDKTMSVSHVLTSLLRLAQITSGHVKWDAQIDPVTLEKVADGVVEQIEGKNNKVEAVVDLLTDEGRDPLGKTLIWCCWKEDIRVITERLDEEGIAYRQYHGGVSAENREKAVRDFNDDPSVRVFIANPATAGEGVNLVGYDWWNTNPVHDTYTDHEIFFSQNWSATQRAQAEDRAHRKGIRQPVRITDLCIPGTIDEEIRARVTKKRLNAMQIQDVRDILNQVLEAEDE